MIGETEKVRLESNKNEFDKVKTLRGKSIIFAALVDDAQKTFGGCFFVLDNSI